MLIGVFLSRELVDFFCGMEESEMDGGAAGGAATLRVFRPQSKIHRKFVAGASLLQSMV